MPDRYALHAAYPNPFNPATTIRFSTPGRGAVRLPVYDMLGREVAVLVDRTFSAGQHTVTFDASGLPNGVLLYRLEAGEFEATRKMLLLK